MRWVLGKSPLACINARAWPEWNMSKIPSAYTRTGRSSNRDNKGQQRVNKRKGDRWLQQSFCVEEKLKQRLTRSALACLVHADALVRCGGRLKLVSKRGRICQTLKNTHAHYKLVNILLFSSITLYVSLISTKISLTTVRETLPAGSLSPFSPQYPSLLLFRLGGRFELWGSIEALGRKCITT